MMTFALIAPRELNRIFFLLTSMKVMSVCHVNERVRAFVSGPDGRDRLIDVEALTQERSDATSAAEAYLFVWSVAAAESSTMRAFRLSAALVNQ